MSWAQVLDASGPRPLGDKLEDAGAVAPGVGKMHRAVDQGLAGARGERGPACVIAP